MGSLQSIVNAPGANLTAVRTGLSVLRNEKIIGALTEAEVQELNQAIEFINSTFDKLNQLAEAADLERDGLRVGIITSPRLSTALKQRAANAFTKLEMDEESANDSGIRMLANYLASCNRGTNLTNEAGTRIIAQNYLQTIQYIAHRASQVIHLVVIPELTLASSAGAEEPECFVSSDQKTLTYITGVADYAVGYISEVEKAPGRLENSDSTLARLKRLGAVSSSGDSLPEEGTMALSTIEVKRWSGTNLEDDLPQAIVECLVL
ncbi:hypothetical protein FRB99_002012 [Tulasnella sp. 403]|nr:hypothetical protein FRB99_002012 [Tulasnella sp. 403]